MEETRRNNPWLGLESYKEGEILYGRDEDIRDLTQSVLNDTDTLLYGRSGIGKSSILNAGVIPAARRNGFQPVLVRFSHKEQHSYLHQVREAIAKNIDIREVVPCKDDDKESLYEFFHRHTFHGIDGERVKLLVIFDQFEEIFTLQENEKKKRRFFAELADLLNDVKPAYMQNEAVKQTGNQEEFDLSDANAFDDLFDALDLGGGTDIPDYVIDNEIHMVFTIREDFLSEFEYYTASIPSLKQNRYGLRPINENQAAQIILNPVPGLIDKEVARLIIEKVTGRKDFSLDGNPEIEVDSAVLSLYLNRLYEAKAKEEEHITAQLVEQKGGEIIADFYLDAISDISEPTVKYLEDKLLNGQNRRENITVFDAINTGHATEAELDILCNKKKILRQFNYAGDLRIEFVHDILCPVVKAHKDERLRLKEEEEERKRQEEEKQRLLQEEEEKRREIERKAEAERAEMQAQALRAKRRNRRRLFALSSLVLLLLAGVLGYWWYYAYERVSYYAAFERVNGWPKGVGKELSKSEMSSTPLYYKLTHRGYKNHDTDVEVRSSNGALPVGKPRIATLLVNDKDMGDEKAKAYYDLLCHVSFIRFVEGEDGKISKEIYEDEKNSVLFIINYFHLGEREAWCQFVTPKGQAMKIHHPGIDRIKLSLHKNSEDKKDPFNGYVESVRFYDASEVCRPAADGICGYSYRYVDENTKYRFALDEFGRPQQAVYNVVMIRKDGEKEEVAYGKATSINDSILEAPGPQGYGKAVTQDDVTQFYLPGKDQPIATREVKRDNFGNVLEEKTKGDLPIPALVKYSYDPKTGYMTSMEKLDAKGNPFASSKDNIYKKHWQYSDDGKLSLEEHWDVNDKKVYFHQVTHTKKVTTDQLEDVANNVFLTTIDSILNDNTTSTTYYGEGGKPKDHETVEGEDYTISCHRIVTKKGKGIITKNHYTLDKKGAVIPCPTLLDDNGKATSYYCREEGFDNEGNLTYYRLLDVDGTVIKSMMRFYQNGQEVARAVMGVDGYGHPVRCPKWEEEGYAYYKLYINMDFNKQYVSVSAVDEWETASVFFDAAEHKYQSISYKDYKDKYILEDDGDTIKIKYSYEQNYLDIANNISNVQLPYLHILNKKSTLYAAGLRDGDRIIGLGAWKQGMANTFFESQWQKMENSSMTITVLRPKGRGFETITKELTRGDTNQEEYHILALTINEEEFFQGHTSSIP